MRYLVTVLVLVAVLTSPGAVQRLWADDADTEAVDAAFKDALLAGDLDAVTALFDEDAVQATPFGTFVGRGAIRAFTEAFLQRPGTSLSFDASVVALNTAVHHMVVTSDPIQAMGISRIVMIQTLVVANGKITTLTAEFDLEDPETQLFVDLSTTRGSTVQLP